MTPRRLLPALLLIPVLLGFSTGQALPSSSNCETIKCLEAGSAVYTTTDAVQFDQEGAAHLLPTAPTSSDPEDRPVKIVKLNTEFHISLDRALILPEEDISPDYSLAAVVHGYDNSDSPGWVFLILAVVFLAVLARLAPHLR